MADNEIVRTRDQMTEELLDQDIEDITQACLNDDFAFLSDILLGGFTGYNNFTDDQIRNEYMDRILPDDAILVIKDGGENNG